MTAPDGAAVEQARAAAEAAAQRSGVTIRSLSTIDDLDRLVRRFIDVWGTQPEEAPMNVAALKALVHAGAYLSGAFRGDEMVGGSVGFIGKAGGTLHLHSHMTGVTRGLQGSNVGFALKEHQRWWALNEGIDEVVWTFDPLVRANAYFNLAKLGADIVDFEPHFYGAMPDSINRGDESDRCVVSWKLLSERAVAASEGRLEPPPVPDDAPVLLDEADGGTPRVLASVEDGRHAKVWIPRDIVAVRARDAGTALEWRRALRETFGAAIASGYVARTMTKEGWYLLERSK